ncbi:hypothetical protein V6N12_068665 [Hibiscus sabdariffa]|uniref:Uncharacterized protein n=1 Tax=Hibiscus sabdariffa TaxID=183260 RepID=A0ABR2FQR4_9ROSI
MTNFINLHAKSPSSMNDVNRTGNGQLADSSEGTLQVPAAYVPETGQNLAKESVEPVSHSLTPSTESQLMPTQSLCHSQLVVGEVSQVYNNMIVRM